MEQKESIYVQRSWKLRSGKFALLAGLALIGSTALTAIAIAQENPFRPFKTICGAEESGSVFSVIEFETKEPVGRGSHNDKLLQTATIQKFPFPNYRLFSLREKRFRVVTQITEHSYAPGQYFAYLALYEELGDTTVLRSGTTMGLDSLKSGFRFVYEIPQSKGKVTCLIHTLGNRPNRGGPKPTYKPTIPRRPHQTNATRNFKAPRSLQ